MSKKGKGTRAWRAGKGAVELAERTARGWGEQRAATYAPSTGWRGTGSLAGLRRMTGQGSLEGGARVHCGDEGGQRESHRGRLGGAAEDGRLYLQTSPVCRRILGPSVCTPLTLRMPS